MVETKKIGNLILKILVASLVITMPFLVQILVTPTYNEFSVYQDGEYVRVARETVNVWDGSAKMRAKSRTLEYTDLEGILQVTKTAYYKDNITVTQVMLFDKISTDVELFPLNSYVECENCEGKILSFTYEKLLDTLNNSDIISPFSFNPNMILEWQDGAYYAKSKHYTTVQDKIIIKYKPLEELELYYVRLFDPIADATNVVQVTDVAVTSTSGDDATGDDWTGTWTTTSGEDKDTYNFSWYNKSGKSLVLGMSMDQYNTTGVEDLSGNDNDGVASGWSFNDGTPSGWTLNAGTLTNSPTHTSSGKYGYGYEFDGVDEYIDLPATGLNYSLPFTRCLWFYDSSSSANDYLLRNDGGNGASKNMYVYRSGTSWRWEFNIATVTAAISTAYIQNVWNHFCLNYNGSHAYTTLNGVDGAYAGIPSMDNYAVVNNYLGNYGSVALGLHGKTDEYRIWDVSLSNAEIQKEMNSRDPVKGDGLVASYSFSSGVDNSTHAKDTNRFIKGQYGQGLAFDGVDDYFTASNPIGENIQHGSYSVDLNFDNMSQGQTPLYRIFGHSLYPRLVYNNGDLYSQHRIDGVTRNTATNNIPAYINAGDWFNVAVTFNNDTGVVIYVDGVLFDNRSAHTGTYFDGGITNLFVGYDSNSVKYTKGKIDNLRIWKGTTLTQAEVQAEMNSRFPVKGDGLVASYSIRDDMDTETTITDTNRYVQGNQGLGVAFDGVDDFFSLNSISELSDISFKLKVKPEAFDSTVQYIINNRVNNATFVFRGFTLSYAPAYGGGAFLIQRNNGSQAVSLYTTTPNIANNEWHDVAATFDSSTGTMAIYVDGNFEASRTDSGGISYAGGHSYYIGGFDASTEGPMSMDDFRIYNYSLSASQISNIYNNNSHILDSDETSTNEDWQFNVVSSDLISYSTVNTTTFSVLNRILLYLDSLNADRKYEHGTVANVSVRIDTAESYCLNISLDAYGNKYVCNTTDMDVLLPVKYLTYTKNSLGSNTQSLNLTDGTKNVTMSVYEYDDLRDPILFNINALSNVYGLTVSYLGDTLLSFLGYIQGKFEIINQTSEGDTLKEIFFSTSGIETIAFNYSASGIMPTDSNCTFTITGESANPEYFKYYDGFTNDSNISSYDNDLSNQIVFNNYTNTDTKSDYTASFTQSILDPDGVCSPASSVQWDFRDPEGDYYSKSDVSCVMTSCNNQVNAESYSTNTYYSGDIDLSDYDMIEFSYTLIALASATRNDVCGTPSSSNAQAHGYIGLRDSSGVITYIEQSDASAISHGSPASQVVTKTSVAILNRTEDETDYKLYLDGVYSKIVSIDSTKTYGLYGANSGNSVVKYYAGATARGSTELEYIRLGGIGPNQSSTTTYADNATMITTILKTFTENYTTVYLTVEDYEPSGSTITYYVSDNNGSTWVTTVPDAITPMGGDNNTLKFKAFVDTGTSTTTLPPHLINYKIEVLNTYPLDVQVDAGGDGVYEWTDSGNLSTAKTVTFVCSELESDIDTYCDRTTDTTCDEVPVYIKSSAAGGLNVSSINITNDISTIRFDSINFTDDIISNPTELGLEFEADSGILDINNISWSYYGNGEIAISAYVVNSTEVTERNITVRYSDWSYVFAEDIDYLEFIPKTPTTKNNTPYGQDSSISILNITMDGGVDDMNFSMYSDETTSCVNITVSASNLKSEGQLLANETWYDLATNKADGDITQLWMWADFDCDYTSWRFWEPEFFFRGCCEDCVCSTETS